MKNYKIIVKIKESGHIYSQDRIAESLTQAAFDFYIKLVNEEIISIEEYRILNLGINNFPEIPVYGDDNLMYSTNDIFDLYVVNYETIRIESMNKVIEKDKTELTFEKELKHLINRYSKENGSDTPDFILVEYLNGCLELFNKIISKREEWYGRTLNENSNNCIL